MAARLSNSQLLWEPITPAWTNIEVFRRMINRTHPELKLHSFQDLYRYSITNYDFWMDLWKYLNIIYSMPPESHSQWFSGARFNYAENILRRSGDKTVCTELNEAGVTRDYSYRELKEMVAAMAASLSVHGLVAGDRVAGIMINSILPIVVALAAASIGAIFTCTSPDMGAKGVLDRYRQLKPKFVFMETDVVYAGKHNDLSEKMAEIVQDLRLHGLHLAVLLPGSQTHSPKIENSMFLHDFLATGDGRPLKFAQLPFSHPLYILFSSGTTGEPKCIIHSAGGILLQTMKDIGFSYGVGENDTLLQYTTTGWMMWNLMVAGLPLGGRLILYDGSPMHPNIPTFLRRIDEQGVSVLGISPRFLEEMHGQNIKPSAIGSFQALRSIAAGGSILTAPLHCWAHEAFGKHIRLMTAMGGTDICSACKPSMLYISCKVIGMRLEVFDAAGNNIEETGEAGEMVCTRPHPSIPVGFWGDENGRKFREAYFSTYPGVWRQGDFMMVNPKTKGVIILGRSDGVLNPSGIRFGSGEIYSILEGFSSLIEDSICVGQRRPQDLDERVLLFLKMRSGKWLSVQLVQEIKMAIKNGLSSRHVPMLITEVKIHSNGKKIEIAVKHIVSGKEIQPSGAVANPESFNEYREYFHLERYINGTKTKL
ncbi:acetoacetate-CoA ligase [Infundibulicybe gibba]|nr:acetoacetate-CoA ligase [Infundibulicybe gibba]